MRRLAGINISSVLEAAFTVLWIVSVHKCMHPYICGNALILDHTKDFWLRNTRWEPRECAVLDTRVGAFSHVYLLVGVNCPPLLHGRRGAHHPLQKLIICCVGLSARSCPLIPTGALEPRLRVGASGGGETGQGG